MDIRLLIDSIRDGDTAAFRHLVARHQRLLYSIVLKVLKDEDADDAVQDTWLIVVERLPQLTDGGKFTPWLCRICRSVVTARLREYGRLPVVSLDTEPADGSVSLLPEGCRSETERYNDLVGLALQLLPEGQRQAIQLRHFAGLSYREAALGMGIPEKTLKSRLYEARRRLREQLPDLYDGLEVSRKHLKTMEEKIMENLKKPALGARVFCRLSQYVQKEMLACAMDNRAFTEDILTELGRTHEGPDFVTTYHTKILFPEFINILNYVDRYTEMRFIHEMERVDPAAAEHVKMSMFVFEDMVILSDATRKAVFRAVDEKLMMQAMSLVEVKVKEELLKDFTPGDRDRWYREMGRLTCGPDEVKAAQTAVIEVLRDMDKRGEVVVERPGGA